MTTNNTGLQGEIRAKDQEIARQRDEVRELIQNRYVPHRRPVDNVLCVVKKNCPDEQGKPGKHKYYMIRCQRRQLAGRLRALKLRYPGMTKREPECDDGNAVHAWYRFKEDVLGRQNFHKNHFTLEDDDTKEFFEDLFGIDM